MRIKKNTIPVKVLVSYLLLIGLVVFAGWLLYSENKAFSETENKIETGKNKILKVNNLLSHIYESENLSRIAMLSTTDKAFENYYNNVKALKKEIDTLKTTLKTGYQGKLLDSVRSLLSLKTNNIQRLRAIKNQSDNEAAVEKAIADISKMESSFQKLQLKDLVKNTSKIDPYVLSVLKKYVEVMNQNIPDDSTNTPDKSEIDSILIESKKLLKEVRYQTIKKNKSLLSEEQKLLQNELSISDQLRKIITIIEKEIITNTTTSNLEKEVALKRTNTIISYAAIAGLFLTVFFSLLILNDVSKSQSYKVQLENANLKTRIILKNREQLSATVSHDLKTPLSTIIGYTELLNNTSLEKKQHYYINNIKTSSEYIGQLVQDLLDFTQIEAGKIHIERTPFSLVTVINEVAESVSNLYLNKNIELIIENDDLLDKNIIGDPFRLKQILSNLVGNAFKFTEQGFIKIATIVNTDTKTIDILIQDSGIGIREEKQKIIFEEFTQADESIEKKYGGTGLGLTISKKIALLLGGDLTLKSTYGKGSTFKVTLPLEPDYSDLKLQTGENSEIAITPGLVAVVVDDDTNLLRLTTEVLKQHGFVVFAFNDSVAALEAIRTTSFNVIITDIQMPVMDGFELLEKIKSLGQYLNQPVIAVTGRGDLQEIVYQTAGFSMVIRKPFTPEKFIHKIKAAINKIALVSDFNVKEETKALADKDYSLKSLKSFLPDTAEALNDVLVSFMNTTRENIKSLEKALANDNFEEIKEISHRMSPMFKQINAKKVSDTLDELEHQEYSKADTATAIAHLIYEINALFLLLETEMVNPDYTI